jgi:hypothetical protein
MPLANQPNASGEKTNTCWTLEVIGAVESALILVESN